LTTPITRDWRISSFSIWKNNGDNVNRDGRDKSGLFFPRERIFFNRVRLNMEIPKYPRLNMKILTLFYIQHKMLKNTTTKWLIIRRAHIFWSNKKATASKHPKTGVCKTCIPIYLTNELYNDREEETGQGKGKLVSLHCLNNRKRNVINVSNGTKQNFLLRILSQGNGFWPSWHSQQDMRLLQEGIPHLCI